MMPDKQLALLPTEMLSQANELPVSTLNPFQLHLFLNLHQYFDQILSINSNRVRIWGPEKVQFNLDEAKQSLRRKLAEGQASSAQTLLNKAAELMVFGIMGIDECIMVAEPFVRGVLDIDKETYKKLCDYFKKYAINLRLDNEPQSTFLDHNDQRFVSNRSWFRSLDANLFGATLASMHVHDAEKYSDANFHAFQLRAVERVKKVIAELLDT